MAQALAQAIIISIRIEKELEHRSNGTFYIRMSCCTEKFTWVFVKPRILRWLCGCEHLTKDYHTSLFVGCEDERPALLNFRLPWTSMNHHEPSFDKDTLTMPDFREAIDPGLQTPREILIECPFSVSGHPKDSIWGLAVPVEFLAPTICDMVVGQH